MYVMKKHIYEIDFIRTICCLGIVIYHFACHTNSNLAFLNYTVNNDIGSVIVTVFFWFQDLFYTTVIKKLDH